MCFTDCREARSIPFWAFPGSADRQSIIFKFTELRRQHVLRDAVDRFAKLTKIQHARYVVQGGFSDEYVAKELKLDLSPERKAILRNPATAMP